MRIGRQPAKRRNSQQKLHAARVRAARNNPRWVEVDGQDLVARGPILVSASTDECFKRHPGVVFERGSSNMIADQAPLHFYVVDGEPVFLEFLPGTWTERFARQQRRRRAS